MPVINNAVFLYTKIQQPELGFEETVRKEFSVDLAVPEKVAKAWTEKYRKQPHKTFSNAEFEKIFKVAPPHEGDQQFVIKLKKRADYIKDGVLMQIPDMYRPRVFHKGEDGKLEDITATKLVSNGSAGVAQFEEITNKFGTFGHLKAIRVDKLIEYKPAGASYDELGEVGELQDLGGIAPAQAQTQAPAAASQEAYQDDGFSDDIPF